MLPSFAVMAAPAAMRSKPISMNGSSAMIELEMCLPEVEISIR